jgi:alpha-D-xyloside xylohydrolase
MPYLFAAAGEAHDAGVPVMRAMPLEFPDDPGCDTLDRQYMLGGSLLVAPVFTPDGTVDYYLPAGRWTHFLTGQVVEGGRWVRERHGYLSLPLLARPNSIIATGAVEDRPDYDFADGVTFHVFEIQDGATLTARVPALKDGAAMTLEVSRWGKAIHVTARGATKPWRVLLRGVAAVQSVEGGTAREDALGTPVIPAAGVGALTARL